MAPWYCSGCAVELPDTCLDVWCDVCRARLHRLLAAQLHPGSYWNGSGLSFGVSLQRLIHTRGLKRPHSPREEVDADEA
jgi:hypothetical protein